MRKSHNIDSCNINIGTQKGHWMWVEEELHLQELLFYDIKFKCNLFFLRHELGEK